MRHPAREMIAQSLAVAAFLLMAVGVGWSALAYGAANPTPYSPLNHLFSELGWSRFSPAAGFFNLCLSAAGILNAPLVWLMGRRLRNRWACAGAVTGLTAMLACCAVGQFPLGSSPTHIRFFGGPHGTHFLLATAFFWYWTLTMALFLIALWRSPVGRRMPSLFAATVFSLAAALAFLAMPHKFIHALAVKGNIARDDFFWIAVIEWLLVGSIGLWLLAAVHALRTRTEAAKVEAYGKEISIGEAGDRQGS